MCLQPWRKYWKAKARLESIHGEQMAETLRRIAPGKVTQALRPSQVLLLHDRGGLGCGVSLTFLKEWAVITAHGR